MDSSLLRKSGLIIAGLLFVQVTLGVFNIVFQLPLYNAVAHNGVGAILLLVMGILMTLLYSRNRLPSEESPSLQKEGVE